MRGISVTIITRNRSTILKRCLDALVAQTDTPAEVIIVDNGSSDDTGSVVQSFRKVIPVRYAREVRVGIPFARNRCIEMAQGSVIAFLDDDCIPGKTWVRSIAHGFSAHPDCIGLLGKTENAHPDNIPSAVEQAYAYRFYLRTITDPEKPSAIRTGLVVDFKNAAFRTSFLKLHRLSETVPNGDVGNNEDMEVGHRLFTSNPHIMFVPSMRATHTNSMSLGRMVWRNFWEGYANVLLKKRFHIDPTCRHQTYPRFAWLRYCIRQSHAFRSPARYAGYWATLAVYPVISKAGNWWARILSLSHTDPVVRIPSRK